MTARQYLEIFRLRWRIVLSGLVLGLGVGVGVTLNTPALYEADVTILVGVRQTPGDNGPTELSQQRLSTYAALLTSNKMLSDVAARLRPTIPAAELAGKIRAEVKSATVLLEVIASDNSPDRAVEIANVVAAQFVESVAQIERPPGYEQPLVTAQVYESATPSVSPVSPKPLFNLALGAGLGALIGAGLALWRHSVDSRIRSRKALQEILDVPVLGVVDPGADLSKSDPAGRAGKSTAVVDAFRTLRTYLRFDTQHSENQVLMLAGVAPDCDASGTACNLAVVVGAAGRRAVVLDADIRRPTVADHFGLGAGAGLTDLLTGHLPPAQALRPVGPNVAAMTCGTKMSGPSELLSSPRMAVLIDELRASHDVVLIVTPPLSAVPDAAAVASHVDGVVLVVREKKSTTPQVVAAMAALGTIEARCVGSVLTPARSRARRKPSARPRVAASTANKPGGAASPTTQRLAVDAVPADVRQQPAQPAMVMKAAAAAPTELITELIPVDKTVEIMRSATDTDTVTTRVDISGSSAEHAPTGSDSRDQDAATSEQRSGGNGAVVVTLAPPKEVGNGDQPRPDEGDDPPRRHPTPSPRPRASNGDRG